MKKSKKMEFITKYTESVLKGTFETFTKPTMTEPDNAMSIPEIIARFTRGQGLIVQQHPWTSGSASEFGEPQNDNENFFEVSKEPAPSQDPASTQEPAPSQEPAPAGE